jgi:mevalonate kinase
LRISVPSKTFLVGEYSALIGGPALVLATTPRFVLSRGTKPFTPHPESPAGTIWKELTEQYEFFDPYFGEGGFGASGAQFLTAKAILKNFDLKPHQVLEDYKKIQSGSGYDVAAQLMGGVSHIESAKNQYSFLEWPFAEMDFLIFKTGHKLNTHESRPENVDYQKLAEQSSKVVQSFVQKDIQSFIEGLVDFRDLLLEQGLVTAATRDLIEEFEMDQDVLMAKGCGAMGADVILVLTSSLKSAAVQERLSKKLRFVANSKNLSTGLRVEPETGVNIEG